MKKTVALLLSVVLGVFAQDRPGRFYRTYLRVGSGYAATCTLSFDYPTGGRETLSTGSFAIGQVRELQAPGNATNVVYLCRAIAGVTIFSYRFPHQNGNHCFEVWGTTLRPNYQQDLCGDDGVDCFDRGIRYGGGFVEVTDVFSEFHCQIECELLEECEFFNFFNRQCVLVNAMEPVSDSPGGVAGPKYCPGTPAVTAAPSPAHTEAPTGLPGAPTEAPIPTGACDNFEDREIILTDPQQWDDAVSACGVQCLGSGPCVTECIQESVGISPACASCYGDTSQCTTDNCFFPCLLNPASQGCRDCSRQNCRPALLECTGFEDGEIPGILMGTLKQFTDDPEVLKAAQEWRDHDHSM